MSTCAKHVTCDKRTREVNTNYGQSGGQAGHKGVARIVVDRTHKSSHSQGDPKVARTVLL